MRIRMAVMGLMALLAVSLPLEGQGRPTRVRAQQDLAFGELLAGVPTTVLPTDGLNAGQIRIWGRRNAEILVSFFMPGGLDGPGGALVPLSFGPGSAGYSASRTIGDQIAFDPSVPAVLRLPQNGQGMIYLGGTATPPASVNAGSYDGTISLTISYLGN
jgi:hypothetical protein